MGRPPDGLACSAAADNPAWLGVPGLELLEVQGTLTLLASAVGSCRWHGNESGLISTAWISPVAGSQASGHVSNWARYLPVRLDGKPRLRRWSQQGSATSPS